MPRVNFVQKARKPNSVVSQEDIDRANNPQNESDKTAASYYWWKFRYGGKHISKTKPKPSQLTQSSFLSQWYELQERAEAISAADFDEGTRDEFVSDLEMLRDECQDSLDNMPESLQSESESGQLLQERIDGLDEIISTIEDIDFDEVTELQEEIEGIDKLAEDDFDEYDEGELWEELLNENGFDTDEVDEFKEEVSDWEDQWQVKKDAKLEELRNQLKEDKETELSEKQDEILEQLTDAMNDASF